MRLCPMPAVTGTPLRACGAAIRLFMAGTRVQRSLSMHARSMHARSTRGDSGAPALEARGRAGWSRGVERPRFRSLFPDVDPLAGVAIAHTAQAAAAILPLPTSSDPRLPQGAGIVWSVLCATAQGGDHDVHDYSQ